MLPPPLLTPEQLLMQASGDHDCFTKKRRHIQTTKTFSCPAKVVVREILRYPDYQVLGAQNMTTSRNQLLTIN